MVGNSVGGYTVGEVLLRLRGAKGGGGGLLLRIQGCPGGSGEPGGCCSVLCFGRLAIREVGVGMGGVVVLPDGMGLMGGDSGGMSLLQTTMGGDGRVVLKLGGVGGGMAVEIGGMGIRLGRRLRWEIAKLCGLIGGDTWRVAVAMGGGGGEDGTRGDVMGSGGMGVVGIGMGKGGGGAMGGAGIVLDSLGETEAASVA